MTYERRLFISPACVIWLCCALLLSPIIMNARYLSQFLSLIPSTSIRCILFSDAVLVLAPPLHCRSSFCSIVQFLCQFSVNSAILLARTQDLLGRMRPPNAFCRVSLSGHNGSSQVRLPVEQATLQFGLVWNVTRVRSVVCAKSS